MQTQWFPRLMTRKEFLQQDENIMELEQRWDQFIYRLGVTMGNISNILEDDQLRGYFLKNGGTIHQLQRLQESVTEVAQFFYRDKQ